MALALVAMLLISGAVIVKSKNDKEPAAASVQDPNWDCRMQGHEPRIQMKNGVVVENWHGDGACKDSQEAAQK